MSMAICYSVRDMADEFVTSCIDTTVSAAAQLKELRELFGTHKKRMTAARKYVQQYRDSAIEAGQMLAFDPDCFCAAISEACNDLADKVLFFDAMREIQSEPEMHPIKCAISEASLAISGMTHWVDYAADVRKTILDAVQIQMEADQDDCDSDDSE